MGRRTAGRRNFVEELLWRREANMQETVACYAGGYARRLRTEAMHGAVGYARRLGGRRAVGYARRIGFRGTCIFDFLPTIWKIVGFFGVLGFLFSNGVAAW